MSIDRRRDRRHYEVTFEASRADYDALAAVLDEAVERFNVDLYPKEKDIPGRISLEKGTAFQFSRVKKALEELSRGLKSEDVGIAINLGDIDTKPARNEPKEEYLGIMEAVTDSRIATYMASRGGTPIAAAGTPIRDMMVRHGIFERKSMAEGDAGRVRLLDDANIRWLYAESLVGPEITSSKIKINSMKALERLEEYPPKINKEDKKRLKKWARRKDFDRAYIVLMEVDQSGTNLNESVHTKPGGWDEVIKELNSGHAILKHYTGKPPKNVGDVYVRMAAYAAGRGFGMRDVAVMPFDISEMGSMPLVGPNDAKKIHSRVNVLDEVRVDDKRYPVYRNFMAFLVVGKGPYKPVGLTRVKEEKSDDLTLPDL